MNNRMLTGIFAAAGARNGYDDVQAEFAPFRDFKVRWTRSYRWISLEVSDYMGDAPAEVMESLADTVYRKIRDDSEPYPEDVCQWITSKQFLRANQPVFVRRYRGLSIDGIGQCHDLRESYGRLVEAGLVERDPDVFLGWLPPGRGTAVGHTSVVMKVVAMSGNLDDESFPEELLDYCLYTQLARIQMGFIPSKGQRGPEYDAMLSRFPDRAGKEAELRARGLTVRGCPPCANTPLHGPTVTPASGH